MRLIGHLESESNARTFGDFLYVQGIQNQVEFSKGEGWGIWVNEEEKIESASQLLSGFRQNPTDSKYRTEAKTAEELRAKRSAEDDAWRKRLRDRRELFKPLAGYGFGPLTFALMIISIIVFVLSHFGDNIEPIRRLFISEFRDSSLTEIRQGQIWRLVTPIFIHFNIPHIFFNMLWMRDLGSMIEGRQSSWLLGLLVLVIAVGSNLAQFYIHHSPAFGGMSGVVYGLLGYIWIRGKLDPASGLFLHPSTVTMMAVWLVLGFSGILRDFIGEMANYTHLGGLLIGMAWGYFSSLRYR